MAKEVPAKSSLTVCGAPQCRCTRIMGHLVDSKTPFFFANNNFTRRTGPDLPAKFVQEHRHEMAMVVNLEAAGKVFAVELVVGKAGDDGSVSMGLGWESFMEIAKFHAEDLLFFTLEGQSRFAVMPVRGHNRRKAEAEPEKPKGKLKPSERLLSDVLKRGASSWAKRAAKQENPGQSSKPAVRNHPPLPPTLGSREGAASQKSIPVQDLKTDSKPANDNPGSDETEMEESPSEFEEDRSDFEDESEFKDRGRRVKSRRAR